MSERWSWNYDCCDMLWHAVTNNGRKWQKHHFPRLSLLRWPHREFEAARDHRTTWQCLGSSLLEKWCVLTKSPDCGETVTKVQVLQWCLMLGQMKKLVTSLFWPFFHPFHPRASNIEHQLCMEIRKVWNAQAHSTTGCAQLHLGGSPNGRFWNWRDLKIIQNYLVVVLCHFQ